MAILEFKNKYDFLSNFYKSDILFEGIIYPTVEHAFQAAKTKNKQLRINVAKQKTPSLAKKEGRKIKLRENWNTLKVRIMYKLVRQKFFVHSDLAKKLLATNNKRLIEGNWWNDKIWGVCNNEGENILGQILMLVRSELIVLDKKNKTS